MGLFSVGDTIGDRVRQCRTQKKWSQATLAKEAGVAQASISYIENNTSDQSKYLPQIAKALQVSNDYLLYGQDYIDKNKGDLSDFVVINGKEEGEKPTKDEYVLIPRFDVAGSCGNGLVVDHVDLHGDGGLVFNQKWLQQQGLIASKLSVIHAKGDSMYPTIEDGQILLLDTADTAKRTSKIYLICIDGEYYIKRLINMITHWCIRSDNPDKNQYPDINIDHKIIDRIQIEGRIVWKSGTL